MNKLLIALCIILSGIALYSNAAVNVFVTEEVFDRIVMENSSVKPYLVIIEDLQMPQQPRYILYANGFYYSFRKQGGKTFRSPNVLIIKALTVADRVSQ